MKIFSIVFILGGLSATIFSQKPIEHLYDFEDFPVKSLYIGKTSKPIITKENRQFRTRIREATKQKVNFAGKSLVSGYKSNRFNCLESSISEFCNGHSLSS